jgi:preprotein translocase subunit SecG
VQPLLPYLNIAQTLVSICLILVILLQARGTGFAAGFSSDSSIFRTRRGLEKTMFQLTIGLAIFFVVISIASAVVVRFEI